MKQYFRRNFKIKIKTSLRVSFTNASQSKSNNVFLVGEKIRFLNELTVILYLKLSYFKIEMLKRNESKGKKTFKMKIKTASSCVI